MRTIFQSNLYPSNCFGLVAMGTIPTGATIQVNANITVNSNRTFTNCTLRMAPNVKIIVNSGVTLTLTNCKVFSCSEMWDGIYVGQGAQVIVSNSRIEDATYAIYSTEAGNYKVTNSIFNKNNVSIQVENYTTHLGEVTGTTFDGTALGSFDPSTATLKAPMTGQKAHIGISINGGNTITVGKPAAPYNYFQNIETGIYVNNVAGVYTPNFSGTVKIYRNNFQNITQTACLGSNCDVYNPEGWPIWTYFTYTVIGDNLGLNYENKFTNCSNGIQLINSRKFSILKNSFTNIVTPGFLDFIDSKSIYILGSTAPSALNTGDISSNTFNNFEYGIYYLGNKQQNLKIEKNELNNFNAKEKHTAIWLLEQQTFNINIQNNIINKPTNLFGSRGILIQNATINPEETSILVQKNSIKNTKNGIWITNMNNVEIRDHHSDYFADDALTTKAGIYYNPTFAVPITNGIKLESSNNTKVLHNTIQRIDYATGGIANVPELGMGDAGRMYGIYVGENCANSDIIDNTTLKMGTGIYVFGNNNNPSTLKCNFMKFHPIGLHINGIIGQQGTSNSPQDNQWALSTGAKGIVTDGTNYPTFTTRSLSMPFMPNPITQFTPSSQAIIISLVSNSSNYGCQEGCANPPCLLPAGLMQVITSTGEYGVLSEEELKALDIELYKSLKISPYDYDAATEEGLKYQEFMDSMDMTNAYRIYDLEKELALKDTLAAQQKLAAFEAFGDVELNYKKVFEVYINNWMKGKYYLAKQDSIKLKEIAFQSPRVAGNAVYMARVMLSIDTIDTETYSAKSMHHSNAFVFDQLKLYPNPSSEYIHYQLPLLENETGWVRIMDVSGKTLTEWRVDVNNTIGSVNVSQYSKGVYLFELNLTNGKSIVKKIVVK